MSNIILLRNKIFNEFRSSKKLSKSKESFYSFLFNKPWFFNKGFKKFDYLEKQNNIWFYQKKRNQMRYSKRYWSLRNLKMKLKFSNDVENKKGTNKKNKKKKSNSNVKKFKN